jgi:hypothetical protein
MSKRVIWKPIPGFENYEVSNQGSVRNTTARQGTWAGRVLKPGKIGHLGHQHVVLYENGMECDRQVHRLILLTFKGRPPSGHVAAHRDGDASNNKLTNLRWATRSENERDKIGHGRSNRGERHGMSKLKPRDIRKMRNLNKRGWNSIEIAPLFPVSARYIRDILKRKRWSHLK